jgi:hypothetical protein
VVVGREHIPIITNDSVLGVRIGADACFRIAGAGDVALVRGVARNGIATHALAIRALVVLGAGVLIVARSDILRVLTTLDRVTNVVGADVAVVAI